MEELRPDEGLNLRLAAIRREREETPIVSEHDNALAFHLAEEAKEVAERHGMKATNPKDAIGSDKIPYHLWPNTATVLGCLGLLDGMLKYGRLNWREAGVRFTIYYDAMRRHMDKLIEGEDIDTDSGLPHEAHILACIAIIVDAKAAGNMVDDRNYPGGFIKLLNEATAHVKRLKEIHKDKHPHHWTIRDVKEEEE